MQFTVGSEFNATSELDRIRTGEYDLMRFMVAGALQEGSFMDSPSAEFYNVSIDWTKPVDKYFNTADCKINDATQWNHGISAVCWDFGRRLYEHFDKKIPIGLVDSAFGGTSMSYWSSPQDVQACSQYDGYFSCEKSKTTTSKVNAGAKPAPLVPAPVYTTVCYFHYVTWYSRVWLGIKGKMMYQLMVKQNILSAPFPKSSKALLDPYLMPHLFLYN